MNYFPWNTVTFHTIFCTVINQLFSELFFHTSTFDLCISSKSVVTYISNLPELGLFLFNDAFVLENNIDFTDNINPSTLSVV